MSETPRAWPHLAEEETFCRRKRLINLDWPEKFSSFLLKSSNCRLSFRVCASKNLKASKISRGQRSITRAVTLFFTWVEKSSTRRKESDNNRHITKRVFLGGSFDMLFATIGQKRWKINSFFAPSAPGPVTRFCREKDRNLNFCSLNGCHKS